jgi:hypothetical protein
MFLLFQSSAVKERLFWTASEDGGRHYELLSVEIRTKLSSLDNIVKEDAHSIYLTNCIICDQPNFSHIKVGTNFVLGCT